MRPRRKRRGAAPWLVPRGQNFTIGGPSMNVYAVSDIHGCFSKYKALLDTLDLRDDKLYILGDIVDRGRDGIKIIMDLLSRKNLICLRGNHDHEALLCLKYFVASKGRYEDHTLTELFQPWLSDGGDVTYEAFLALEEEKKRAVLSFLNSMPLYEKIEIKGKKYFLAHTVPEKSKMLSINQCEMNDFIIGEPEYERCYFEDIVIVTGHTPTGFIDPSCVGRIWRGNNHIAIDCGAVFGNPLGCICLDTMEEIYVK